MAINSEQKYVLFNYFAASKFTSPRVVEFYNNNLDGAQENCLPKLLLTKSNSFVLNAVDRFAFSLL